MEQYIPKSALVAEIKRYIKQCKGVISSAEGRQLTQSNFKGRITGCEDILSFIDTLEVEDVANEKTKWSPSKKQMESLKDMLRYNIGVFDYQKFMEVNSLYDDLTKILDYETDRQK